jgi:transposase
MPKPSAKPSPGPTCASYPSKSAEQQAILSLHRVRQGYVEERTATINRIRGLLTEFGIVLPQRADEVRRAAVVLAEQLPLLAREAIVDLRAHLAISMRASTHYEQQLTAHESPLCPCSAGS